MAMPADVQAIVDLLNATADAVVSALATQQDWEPLGPGGGQYRHDIVADAAALAVLDAAGVGVLSEESGLHHPERPVMVVLDPVDGSTNASRGLPWWAVSLCALGPAGPIAAVVDSPGTKERFVAVKGEGSWRNGVPISPRTVTEGSQAIVGVNGYPEPRPPWAQFRALGAAALELCAVACGALDGFVDCSRSSLAPWDYLGGMLVCMEAGACVQDAYGRELVVTEPGERRAVVAACGEALLYELAEQRQRAV